MNALSRLEGLLKAGPVMADAHVLLPAALHPAIRIEARARAIASECDDPAPQVPRMILIQEIDARWADRFATWREALPPKPEDIDRHLAQRLGYVRARVLSQAAAGALLAQRFLTGNYDCGLLLLIDGLSYFDCTQWPENPEPCFVDGPSVTEFGFLQITQVSGMVARLNNDGRYRLRGYSYWERDRNDLADRIFAGVPLERIRCFPDALSRIRNETLRGQFLFLLREGLDGLAHGVRELTQTQRDTAIHELRQDFCALAALARSEGQRAMLALLADHGLAWRESRGWQVVERYRTS